MGCIDTTLDIHTSHLVSLLILNSRFTLYRLKYESQLQKEVQNIEQYSEMDKGIEQYQVELSGTLEAGLCLGK